MTRAAHAAARSLALLGVLAALGAPLACRREPAPTPEAVAYQFRDVFPYPAITGGSDVEVPELRPLQDGYLLYVSRTDFSGAADEFARVAARHPDLVEARLLQGISLVLAGREAEAVPTLEGVVAQRPGYPPARWFLAQALLALGRREEGLEQMREVVRLDSLYREEAGRVLAAAAGD